MRTVPAIIALSLLAGLSQAVAQESAPASPPKNAVTIEWFGAGEFTTRNLTGDENAYKTLLNRNNGLTLTRLSLVIFRPDKFVDEIRMDLSGFGADPEGAVEATLRKYSWYRLDLRDRYRNSFFDVPALALGQHGHDAKLRDTGGELALFPGSPVRVDLGFNRNRYDGDVGTTFATTADVFALNSAVQRTSNEYRARVSAGRGPTSMDIQYGHTDDLGREAWSLPGGAGAGINPNDPAVLREISSDRPVEESRDRITGIAQYLEGPVQFRAQYSHLQAGQHATTDRHDVETTRGGAVKDITQVSDSKASRLANYGKLLGRWRIARPLSLRVTFWSGSDKTNGTAFVRRTGISVGVPISMETDSATRVGVTQREGNVDLELGSFGPFSFDLGGGIYGRSIGSEGLGTGGPAPSVDQTGRYVSAGAQYSDHGWRVKANQEVRTVDRPFTDAGARREGKNRFNVRYKAPRGFYVEGTATRRLRTEPAGRRDSDALTLGAGYEAGNVSVRGGYTWLDAKNRIAIFSEDGEMPSDLTDDWTDRSTYLGAEWTIAPFCRAEFHANRLDTTGPFACKVSRVEPRINFLFKRFRVMMGGFRYDYAEEVPQGRSFRSEGLVMGATFLPAPPAK
ncbi:MAG: hypothetical protein V1798_03430 [Pseudomonadota bacterium]